jgi:hypothetical protein
MTTEPTEASWQLARQTTALSRAVSALASAAAPPMTTSIEALRRSVDEATTVTAALEALVDDTRNTLDEIAGSPIATELFHACRSTEEHLTAAEQRAQAAQALIDAVLGDIIRAVASLASENDPLTIESLLDPGTDDGGYWLRPCPATAREEYPPPYP